MGTSPSEFFIPRSKRPKRKDEITEEKVLPPCPKRKDEITEKVLTPCPKRKDEITEEKVLPPCQKRKDEITEEKVLTPCPKRPKRKDEVTEEKLSETRSSKRLQRKNEVTDEKVWEMGNSKRVKRKDEVTEEKVCELGKSSAEFFMPKRRKRKDEPTEEKVYEAGNFPAKPEGQVNGHREDVRPVTTLHSMSVKERKYTSKATLATLPENATVQCVGHHLRLEAVLAAQENARLNAGKTTHPFFSRKVSSLKTSVLYDETTFQVEDLQPCPPIHVTQCTKDEKTEATWMGWNFSPVVVNGGIRVDEFCKTVQNRCRLLQPFRSSISLRNDRRPDCHVYSANSTAHALDSNMDDAVYGGNESTASLKALQDLLKNMQTLKSVTEAMVEQAQLPEVLQSVDADLSLENLKNRLTWYRTRHDTLNAAANVTVSQISNELDGEVAPSTRNLLWTDLYQPKSSTEVCGNTIAVEKLRSWLHNWQQKITGQLVKGEDANKVIHGVRNANYDSDAGWFEDDSDIESDVDDDTGLHCTLLITGPEGCGKSAAVYACAGEQGFTVIEVNASDCRNGALIKHKFGEAMESHGLGKVPQVGAESPMRAIKKETKGGDNSPGKVQQVGAESPLRAINKAIKRGNNSPGQSTQSVVKQKKAVTGKRLVDRSPLKAHQDRKVSSQDESQTDSQSKGMTVILFEDVDTHFEEDKGFLPALVQLSKITKRPIILTSNRHEPGLPPVLEKCKIDFTYPSSQELVLHACLVSIVECMSCSPWFVERLVDSCQFDLRKVMMALQFWGQGKLPVQRLVSSRSIEVGKTADDLGHNKHVSNGRSSRLSLGCRKLLNVPGSSKMKSLARKHDKAIFEEWESEARWLFELDVHHLILPKVISESFVCPFSLHVGETICTAVRKKEEHAAQVAASKTEARSRALQTELAAAELMRKAEKKEKDIRRRACQPEAQVREYSGGATSHAPNEDNMDLCGKRSVHSPTKSVRRAKTLARSPLKTRRALRLCYSDDEEQTRGIQPETKIEAGNQSISNMENLPGVHLAVTQAQDYMVDIVNEELEDLDVTCIAFREDVKTVTRKRLSKKVSCKSNGVTNLESLSCPGSVSFRENGGTILESGPGHGSVNIDAKVPPVKLKSLDTQLDDFVPEWQLASHELPPKILLEENNNPLVSVDQNDRLTKELNPMSSDDKPIGSFETGNQQAVHRFSHNGDQDIESVLLSGGENSVNTAFDNNCTLQPGATEGCNHVNDSELISDRLPQLCGREEVGELGGLAIEIGRSSIEISLSEHSESADGTVDVATDFSLSAVVVVDSQKAEAVEESGSDLFDPVGDAWTKLRDSQRTLKPLMNHAHPSADVMSSLADLSDVISASDVISCVETEQYKDAWRGFNGRVSASYEGNIGHCSDWDGCQEIASQIVRAGLQSSLTSLPFNKHLDHSLLVLSCILESAKDAPSVAKCMVTHSDVTSKMHGTIGNAFGGLNPTKQVNRQNRLEDVVQTALPRGRVSRSGLVEYSTYLSRISQLEEIRRTHGFGAGRRPRRFEHYLTKLRSLGVSDIMELLTHSNFRKFDSSC